MRWRYFYDPRLGPGEPRTLRRLPRLFKTAISLVWQASPPRFLLTTVIKLVTATGIAAQVLATQRAATEVFSAAGSGRPLDSTLRGLVPVLAITAGLRMIRSLESVLGQGLTLKVERASDAKILDVATAVELSEFEDSDFYNLLDRAQRGFSGMGFVSSLISIMGAAFGIVAVGASLFKIEPILVALVGLTGIPVFIVNITNARRSYDLMVRYIEKGRRRNYLRRLLVGRDEAKEIRAFGLNAPIRVRYEDLYDEWIGEQTKLYLKNERRSLAGAGGAALLYGATLGFLLLLILRPGADQLPLAAATAAFLAIQQLRNQFTSAIGGIQGMYDAGLRLQDYEHFLSKKPAPTPGPLAHPGKEFSGLEAEGVSFTYPGSSTPALDGVSIEIKPGEIVALVGENGSGKTTLAKLLCQLYKPSSGRILWNGQDVTELDTEELRRQIAVIFQDFVKYQLTAKENISLGRHDPAAEEAEIAVAAKRAGADTVIDQLPEGYATVLSKEFGRGSDLSIGQWQRLALARAFFRDAPFVVLDEPTAALDPRAEHDLFNQIRSLYRGRTVLLISHRFSSVRTADRIYVLEHGRVQENGSHEELMESDGLYAELFTLQAKAFLESSFDEETVIEAEAGPEAEEDVASELPDWPPAEAPLTDGSPTPVN